MPRIDQICWFLLGMLVPAIACPGEDRAATPADPEQIEFFEKRIRPLLVARCLDCHGSKDDEIEGGLRLDSRAAVLRGGDSGRVVRPGDPDASLLIKAVRYADPLLQMPPDEKLADREIEALVRWVEMGLPDPRESPDTPSATNDALSTEVTNRDWWSFQPVRAPALPPVQRDGWPISPVDFFVLARLEAEGMQPAVPADRRTLIRRATLDLIGLPPSPAEIHAFLSDTSPNAFARVVDRLLASHHYGERWGRHWLDVVRYADTSGCNGDFPVPEAYRYRNYVIGSWNADKPYDRFLREQLAGDLLPAASEQQRHEQIVATGYLAISRRFSSLAEEFHLTLDDTVDNLGKAILGLTISCARCHEHKFDPIPQADYYALYGIFQSTRYAFPGTEIYRHTQDLVPLESGERLEMELRSLLSEMNELDDRIFETYTKMAATDTGKEKNALRAKWNKMKEQRDVYAKRMPSFEMAYAVSEDRPVNVRLHIKGDPENLGPTVPRGSLQILGGQQLGVDETGSGRLQLARWLTEEDNPLTARVLVNRIWLHHFGKGIVRTPNDFGTRGALPTHPLLLDFLTLEFRASGWSVKDLHRRIMFSRAYQMAVVEDELLSVRDPDNRRLWTFERRRLDAEQIRDSMLSVSGALDRSRGGPHSFKSEWEWRYSQHRPFVGDFPTRRRSIYLMQQRIRQQPYLAVFDGADANAATGVRQISMTPQQALFMMNGHYIHEQARYFAEQLVQERDNELGRLRRAFELALGRPPAESETIEAAEYLARLRIHLRQKGATPADVSRESLASYLRVLLSSNEFVFVE